MSVNLVSMALVMALIFVAATPLQSADLVRTQAVVSFLHWCLVVPARMGGLRFRFDFPTERVYE